MRIIASAFLLAAGVLLFSPAPASAQECQLTNCSTECWAIPGGRRCARHCTRRCWRPAPRYEPQYVAPQYVPGPRYADPIPIEPIIIGIGVLAVLAALFLGAFTTASTGNEIAEIEQSTASMRSLAHDAEDTAHAIDTHIEEQARASFQRGRAAAYKEWTGE